MEEQIIIKKTEKPNSFEFGKVGNRFKVYYDTPEELKAHLDNLKSQGFELEIFQLI